MRKCRVHELQKTQTILSGSSEDADLMLEDELRALSTEKKEQLLHDAGITVNRPPMITHCNNTIKPDTIQRLGKCLLLIHGQVIGSKLLSQ